MWLGSFGPVMGGRVPAVFEVERGRESVLSRDHRRLDPRNSDVFKLLARALAMLQQLRHKAGLAAL